MMESPQQRFDRLLSLVLDGSPTEDDREELAQLVVENPGFEADLVDAVVTHSLIQWQCADGAGVLMNLHLPKADASSRTKSDTASRTVFWRGAPVLSQWKWAAAVLLAFVGGTLAWRIGTHSNSSPLAQLVAAEGVQWSDNSTALRADKSITSGRLQSSAGVFTLKFRSGPTVRFSGPSTVNIESDMLIALEHGQATADVPESGVGFTIKTANVHVIDQGTQFGVATEGGNTDVVVFKGKVDLQNQIRTANAQQRLVRGEAVTVDAAGAVNRIMQIGQNAEGDWWTTDRPDLDSTIEEVRDNIPEAKGRRIRLRRSPASMERLVSRGTSCILAGRRSGENI
jgi:hypothetical protein